MTEFVQELDWRGMIFDASEGLREASSRSPLTAYVGFDPSASSLHVGSLLPIMALVHLQRAGNVPIALVGGGTGMIGDPSGKVTERPIMKQEQIASNLQSIQGQLSHFIDFKTKTNNAILVNNADWLGSLSLQDFLRGTGKHFTVNYMLGKESVSRRLEGGISFTEFAYMLLQAFDYLQLFERHGCTLQMGGSDQWGNITAGIELVRRVHRANVHGLVLPLVTNTAGAKFGKTEAGTIWLDPKLTSPYRFYQFWLNTDDRDVIRYLRYFTFLGQDAIEDQAARLEDAPHDRVPHQTLAKEVTRLVHGDTALGKAERATNVLFGGDVTGLAAEDLKEILADVPSTRIPKSDLTGAGLSVTDLAVMSHIARSKADAARLAESGGVYINNIRVSNPRATVTLSDAIEGSVLLIRKGTKEYRLIELV